MSERAHARMWKERILIIIVVVLLVGVSVSVAWVISSLPKGKQWTHVDSWSGSQTDYNMTTENFFISGEEWQIYWNCTEQVSGSYFQILVHDYYTGNLVEQIDSYGNTSNGALPSGLAYLGTSGRFYLQIFINGELGNWTVTVSQYT